LSAGPEACCRPREVRVQPALQPNEPIGMGVGTVEQPRARPRTGWPAGANGSHEIAAVLAGAVGVPAMGAGCAAGSVPPSGRAARAQGRS
jgi:hypothetical protein